MIGQQLLSLLYGDPADQISRTLNPNPAPNPNPGAPLPVGAQGGGASGGAASAGGGPSGAPSSGPSPPQPPMAPANATQSPPDLAALYVKLHKQDRAANQIDRGTALMASAFGTAQQQHDMMNYAQNLQPDDRGAMLANILKDQAAQTQMQEHQRFMAGSAGMAKLLGVDQPTAAWMMNDETLMKDALSTHFANMTKTDLAKNVDDAGAAYAQAHPGATPADIAEFKSKIYTMATDPAAKETATVQAKDAQEFKDTATQDYTPLNSKLTEQQNTVKRLLANFDDTVAAIKGTTPVTGPYGNWNPLYTQNQKDQAVLIDKLKAALTGESLSNVKNVRNKMEFQTLGNAVTAGLTQTNSSDGIKQALIDIQNKILDAKATNELASGHKLTGDLVGHGNRDLLDPKSPYYNGGSEEAKPEGQGGSSGGATYTYNPKTGKLE